MFTIFKNKNILLPRPAKNLKKRIWNVFYFMSTAANPQKLIYFQSGKTKFLKCDNHNHTHSALLCNGILPFVSFFLVLILMIKFGKISTWPFL